jgi:hypothetical protein
VVDSVTEQMVVFADDAFAKVDWHPPHLRLCQRGEWNDRMIIETVLSMLTLICRFKKVMHRAWEYFKSHGYYSGVTVRQKTDETLTEIKRKSNTLLVYLTHYDVPIGP